MIYVMTQNGSSHLGVLVMVAILVAVDLIHLPPAW